MRQPGSAIGLTEKGAEKALRTRMESHVAAPKAAHDEDGPMTFTRAATQLYAHYQPSGHESDLIDQMFEHDDSADSIAQSIAQSDLI